MSKSFSLYPVLSSDLIDKAGIQTDSTSLSYLDDGEYLPLAMEDIEGDERKYSARLSGVRWSADDHNFIMEKGVRILHPDLLFGKEGIVPHDAVIGVAGIWSSKRSDLHGTIVYEDFRMGTNPFEFRQEYRFESGILKGSIHFKLVLYLKSSGHPYATEMHLANQSGVVLGVIEEFELLLEGNGSEFPISEVSIPGRSLWWVQFNSDNPFEDAFDDRYVSLCLNTAHPLYNDLKVTNSLRESALFLEVISSALFIIIQSVKECVDDQWYLIKSGHDFEQGTIAEAVSYFMNKLGWSTATPVDLADSIRNYFEKNLR